MYCRRLLLLHQQAVPSCDNTVIASARQSLVVSDPSNCEVLVLVEQIIETGIMNYDMGDFY